MEKDIEQKKYWDETLSDEERVEALIEEMTLEEKTAQLRYNAPAIKRLTELQEREQRLSFPSR